jgi:multiple sugar transport system permease protein
MRNNLFKTVWYVVLLAIAGVMVVPFVWMLATSLQSLDRVFRNDLSWLPIPPQWSNYQKAWTAMPFDRFFLNSIFVAVAHVAGQVATSALAAYAFARLKFPFREQIFTLYLGTLMIPAQVTIIPNFILMRDFGWVDSYWALIVPGLFSTFGTFLLRQFFLTIPSDLEDAAKIDGANHFDIFVRVALPLSGPALATLAIFVFLGSWNSFLWPLIVTNSIEMRTIPVGLRVFQGQFTTNYPLMMAAASLALVPILIIYMLGQKYFVRGITLTGMGGR